MAKREREEEFEVSEVAPLQPLSSPTVACTLVQRSLPIVLILYTALYNDLYHYQC